MGTFQHFFHECKWHWHIGDVFLNILVSYLHFFDFVWISYEVFKLTVKRSKGKSIRGAKWLGQNRWLLGIRGKTDEWDTTRGINLIIPRKMHRLTCCTLFSCLTIIKYGFRQNNTKSKIWTWGFSGVVVCCSGLI